MNNVGKIISTLFKIGGYDAMRQIVQQGGDDALKTFFKGMAATAGTGKSDAVSKLLAGLTASGSPASSQAVKEIFGFFSEQAGKVASTAGDDICKMATREASEYVDDAAKMVSKPAKISAVAPKVKNEAYRVSVPKEKVGVDAKIAKIKELLIPEEEAYKVANKTFKDAQRAGIDKFNEYVENYVGKYSDLVAKLDVATSPEEIKAITKQLEKLDKQAGKTMGARLEKIGTLSAAEIQEKIVQAKELAKTRVQNITYSQATTVGARKQAEEFIAEVSKEFNTGGRELTPEQLDFVLKSRINKIRKLVSKATLEEKATLKRTLKFGGMDMPVEFPVMGTAATEEIAKLTNGKTPKEALEYYKILHTKMQSALQKIQHADISDSRGYLQLREGQIEIPIKDLDEPDKLKWLKQQLAEKKDTKIAERTAQKGNRMIAKRN